MTDDIKEQVKGPELEMKGELYEGVQELLGKFEHGDFSFNISSSSHDVRPAGAFINKAPAIIAILSRDLERFHSFLRKLESSKNIEEDLPSLLADLRGDSEFSSIERGRNDEIYEQ